MSSIPKVSYTVAHDIFYEPLTKYQPDFHEFHDVVDELLPESWRIVRVGTWFHAVPDIKRLPAQGWKIHLSTVPDTAAEMLRRVTPILLDENAPFKFNLDQRILSIVTSKAWHRGAAGKFATIYPDDEEHFLLLAERIHDATRDLRGPYILSDRRFKDSQVVYYRYGGISPVKEKSASGDTTYTIENPEGETVEDERNAYFALPDWVEDPVAAAGNAEALADAAEARADENTLKNGRYKVRRALAFSNSGGVYVALDQETGNEVVIKEGRPHTNLTPSGDDSVALVEKEYQLLRKLNSTNIAPKAFDFFYDWEHAYVVMEYLGDVPTLRFFSSQESKGIVLKTDPTREEMEAYWNEYVSLFSRLADMLDVLHDREIVFMDLSINNVLVLGEDPIDLRLIDFEGAFEPETEESTLIFTPGFASASDLSNEHLDKHSDYFSFGALMLAYILPINGMLDYDPDARMRFLHEIAEDFALPSELPDVAGALLHPDPNQRPAPSEAMTLLRGTSITEKPRLKVTPDNDAWCRETLDRSMKHLHEVMSPERDDRLFPCDPKTFVTNPFSVAYGAAGVLEVLHRIIGEVPKEAVDWLERHQVDASVLPPGLHLGASGLAWTLENLGSPTQKLADELWPELESHPQLGEEFDLFYGTAGWGMAQLAAARRRKDPHHLHNAIHAGEALWDAARRDDADHAFWISPGTEDQPHRLGYAHGSSGIALFLLYLYRATGAERYLDLGQSALAYDLARSSTNHRGVMTWRLDDTEGSTQLPYLRYGSAGVARTLARYARTVDDPASYLDVLESLFPDLDRKYAIFPGQSIGLAGIGEGLLDLVRIERFTERAEAALERIVSGIRLFAVESRHGLAFPGYELFRLSADFATGAAGIASFIHRFLHRAQPSFLLDELIAEPVGALKHRLVRETAEAA